jgi:dienelactone hydrolase
MKRLLLLLLLLPCITTAQNYLAKADSCIKIKDYACAAANYDLALKSDTESNGIAYMSSKAWGMAGDKDKTISAIRIYVRNNALNNWTFFSEQLLKEKSFNFLHNDSRWNTIIASVQRNEAVVRKKEHAKKDSIFAFQKELESYPIKIATTPSARDIYRAIKNYNNFQPISKQNFSMRFRLTDSLSTSYLVCLPPNYNPKKSYPVLFFLHGAVAMNHGYTDYADTLVMSGWNRYYTKYAPRYGVIMVYPNANKDYNWMYPDAGFFMIPAMLKQLKAIVNVDDDRVFITGHSNGATGSFSYLMKQPSPFAGFYGFNTRPRVATGGTYVKNILNRSYFNVSTDQDYYYPPNANDSLDVLMKNLHADYQDHRYNGFPHWFPKFDQSEPAYQLLFDDLARRSRDPFHKSIYWECDDIKYGRCDWIAITGLDTLKATANWQTQPNFKIHKWLVLDEKSVVHERDTLTDAFRYRKRSGTIRASYSNNKFDIVASDVKSVRIYLSPDMVNFSKPIVVEVNGKVLFNKSMNYDKHFMLSEFDKTLDRKAVWVNYIDINLH